MRAEPVTPQGIAGGFVLVPVGQLLSTWRACRQRPLGVADFRTWLACREMVARRCTCKDGRPPAYGFAELSRLTGVTEKRGRASVRRLVAAGLLTWSVGVIAFPETGSRSGSGMDAGGEALNDTIGGGKGSVAVPRRILRLMAGGARPALIATALAVLLRCLARGRGGFRSRGRLKASWIARVFDVDLRRVKQARKEWIDLGWIIPEQTDRWAENAWGRTFHIELAWDRAAVLPDGHRLPPPSAAGGPRLPPPDSHPEPLREIRNQEPAPPGPAGVEFTGTEETPASLQPVVGAEPSAGEEKNRATDSRRPTETTDGAGGGPLPAPTLNDVRVEDLRDTGRLLRLHEQAVARKLVGASEADRLRFVAAAEHARAVGTRNPPGLFVRLVRGRLWRFLTQADEDTAAGRLKRHLFGAPKGVSGSGPRPSVVDRPRLSADALVVREVRAAVARAGYRGDPFPLVRARDGSWTRARWDGALSELERWRNWRPRF